MNQLPDIGRILLIVGIGIALLGGIIMLAGRLPLLQNLGGLPGDIRWQSADGRFGCFAPITTMILLSIILTVVLNVVLRLLNRQ